MRGFRKSIDGAPVLAAIGLSVLLSGCGWFDGPPALEKLRPGAERAISPSDSLPASRAQNYDAAIAPVDETRGGPAIGSVVAASGGQKAQLEKLEKEAAARDAEDRAQRERLDANKPSSEPPILAKTVGTGDKPGEPATQPAAAPRAPVSAAPVPPPASAPTDGDPLGPNNTPTKPAGT